MYAKFYDNYRNMVSMIHSFDLNQVEFLGYIVSSEGISMDLAKVQTILEWRTPQSVHDVQCFLGFASFYHKSIKNYSKKFLSLTQLTHKTQQFIWNSSAAEALESLKHAFTSTPILIHANQDKPLFWKLMHQILHSRVSSHKQTKTGYYIQLLFIRGNLKLQKLIMRLTTRSFWLL